MANQDASLEEIRHLLLHFHKARCCRIRSVRSSRRSNWLTRAEILLPDTRDPRPVVRHLLPGPHKQVEDGRAVIVDDGDACEGGFRSLWPDADHLAIDREELTRAGRFVS